MDKNNDDIPSHPRQTLAIHPTVDVAQGCLSGLRCSSSPEIKTDKNNRQNINKTLKSEFIAK